MLTSVYVHAAKPKVADYPFTTLVPNLGVCEMNYRTTVFADIPGGFLVMFFLHTRLKLVSGQYNQRRPSVFRA